MMLTWVGPPSQHHRAPQAAESIAMRASCQPVRATWYEEQDLNLHTLRYRNLNPARLPFRHPRAGRGVPRKDPSVKIHPPNGALT